MEMVDFTLNSSHHYFIIKWKLIIDCALQVPKWLTYDFPPHVKAKVNRLWGGDWHGQAQKWCVFFLFLLADPHTWPSIKMIQTFEPVNSMAET